MPSWAQCIRSASLDRKAGENWFCTLARLPSPSTRRAMSICSMLALEIPASGIFLVRMNSPGADSAARRDRRTVIRYAAGNYPGGAGHVGSVIPDAVNGHLLW